MWQPIWELLYKRRGVLSCRYTAVQRNLLLHWYIIFLVVIVLGTVETVENYVDILCA